MVLPTTKALLFELTDDINKQWCKLTMIITGVLCAGFFMYMAVFKDAGIVMPKAMANTMLISYLFFLCLIKIKALTLLISLTRKFFSS